VGRAPHLLWVSAGLGAAAAVLALAVVPAIRASGRFDAFAAAGLAACGVCLPIAISKGGNRGWAGGTTLGFLAAAVVILLLWDGVNWIGRHSRWSTCGPPRASRSC
jgi:hypothetical protein